MMLFERAHFLGINTLQLACWDFEMRARKRRVGKGIRFSHQHLKTRKIANFCGCSCNDGGALWLMKVAVELEKIVIDPEDKGQDQKPPQGKATMPSARSLAQRLQAKVPSAVNFLTL